MKTIASKNSPIEMPEFVPFRKLDAGAVIMDQATQIRSEARLAQILAGGRGSPSQVPKPSRVSAPLRLGRWVAVPVLAAAIIAAVTLLPHDAGLVAPAFANWTAVPISMEQIPADALASYDAACRRFIDDKLDNYAPWVGAVPRDTLRTARGEVLGLMPHSPTLAETRGDLTWLSYQINDEQAFNCVLETAPLPATAYQIMFINLNPAYFDFDGELIGATYVELGPLYASGGGGGGNSHFGVSGPIPADQAVVTSIFEISPLPATVLADAEAAEQLAEAQDALERARSRTLIDFWNSGQQVRLRLIDGQVGGEVTGVVLHIQNGEHITATVNDGRFMAWYPHPATMVTERTIESLTLTLRDGTTVSQAIVPGQLR